MNSFNLSGRVAVVTGGNGGIGLAMAEGLASAGADIVIAARDSKKGAKALTILQGFDVRSTFIQVDVRDPSSISDLVESVVRELGGLHILVNNAGTNDRKQPEEYALEEWQTIIDTNLTSAFVASQKVYPHMSRAGGGKIINIGSMMSIFGASFTVPYASSKGGIVQRTKGMACAWAKDNVQVILCYLDGLIQPLLVKQGSRWKAYMIVSKQEHLLADGAFLAIFPVLEFFLPRRHLTLSLVQQFP